MQLDEQLANQIAAGEVVERPAAVVKELVENSLDAGATRIVVRIGQGGRRLIEVEDDGHGMRPDDLRRCVGRHATSKLRDAAGLFRIATLGFRGEALPSIAAVSELELASRPHAAEAGARLVLEGGSERRFEPTGMAPGTRVSVRNLFWNVPARLKFLKSEAAEAGQVADAVLRLALGHPTVAFRLEHDGREVLDLPGTGSLAARIRQAYGDEAAADLLPVAASHGQPASMQLAGFAGHPRSARPTGRRQVVILNGRFVRDRILIAAIREGYAGFLEPRLHPSVFLTLDMDPGLVDVNVHPAKAEVRFVREGEVFALVRSALAEALGAHRGGFSILPGEGVRREVVRPLPSTAPPPPAAIQERYLPVVPQVEPPASPSRPAPAQVPAALMPAVPAPMPALSRAAEPRPTWDAPPASPAPEPTRLPAGVRRVVQLHDMYLLIETDRGIRLVDQHALHERALLALLDDRSTRLDLAGRQELAIPIPVALGAAEVAACLPLLDRLRDFAIDARPAGPTALAVHAHPARLRRLDWIGFFTDVAADGLGAVDQLRERLAHRLACRAAVKAGQRLSPEEQLDLVALLYRWEGMEHCPHGRPTTLDLGWDELARRFQR